jgi:hypothetical protein
MLHTQVDFSIRTIFQDSFAHIYYASADGIIHAEWNGYLKPEDTRRACKTLIDFVTENQVSLHLSAHAGLKILSLPIQEFLIIYVLPALEKGGLRKMAVLLSEDVFAQATVENVHGRACCQRLEIRSFASSGAATKWLKEE